MANNNHHYYCSLISCSSSHNRHYHHMFWLPATSTIQIDEAPSSVCIVCTLVAMISMNATLMLISLLEWSKWECWSDLVYRLVSALLPLKTSTLLYRMHTVECMHSIVLHSLFRHRRHRSLVFVVIIEDGCEKRTENRASECKRHKMKAN